MGREDSISTRHRGLKTHRISGEPPEDTGYVETTGETTEGWATLKRGSNTAMLGIQALFWGH